ncbi:MAG: type II toxin-antitoxin system RelE/ParE family toxin [Firmicutes bacterium]|jgi:mRNA interferase RelE/StbE|nr:type II toxin-antitoxin system RelE/ParE family toxin [Dethiobacter sp.]MCL5992605.1 type II toxin-antitoxin system RelE/ParE family toxin [Bacillota bacterium]
MRVKPKNANRFRHEFLLLERQDRERVFEVLKTLAETPVPPNSICLEKNYYRIRTGSIRVIYQLIKEEDLILVGAVLKRNENTYKDWKRYFR